jgi:uroporphyrinogen III methyltransferase/synthase
MGAEVIEMPATRIEPLDQAPLDAAVGGLGEYQWVVFTSQNAVRLFWESLRRAGLDARALANCRVAAVGPATGGALLDIGIVVDLAPERFVAEAMLDAMRAHGSLAGARVLYAAAEGAREVLPAGLAELGARVDLIPIYRSVPDAADADELRGRIESGEVDAVTFTSASAVTAFVAAVGTAAARAVAAVSIGPITSQAARAAGLRVLAEASPSTIGGLADAVGTALAR